MYSNITMIIPISLIFIVPALYTMWYMTTIELSYRIVSGLDKLGFCSYNVASGTRTLWADEVLWEPEWATLSREEPKRLSQSEPEWHWQSTPEIEPEWVRVTETEWAWDRARVNQRDQEFVIAELRISQPLQTPPECIDIDIVQAWTDGHTVKSAFWNRTFTEAKFLFKSQRRQQL